MDANGIVRVFLFGMVLLSRQVLAKDKLLLLLVDGMRWDHFAFYMPSLDLIEENGVRAEWMDGVFITKSAPSMFSIATGLYIEHHGVVHNRFFDASTGELSGGYSETLNTTWWFNGAGQPLWITAMSQGLRAGSFMYPGGQTPIGGIYPDRYIGYSSETYKQYINILDRADMVLDWLYKDGLDVVFLYVGKLDDTLHASGIGEEAAKMAAEVDELIGYILSKMEELGSTAGMNFIVTSDHGMAEISSDKALSLFDYVDESQVEFAVTDGGSTFQILPVEGALEEVYRKLKTGHPSINIYKKEEFPSKFHYANNPRNLPLMGYMDKGWTFYQKVNQSTITEKAGHGYDNGDMSMKSSFYAIGPAFRNGYRAKHFESVNIYPLMCEILGIMPAPNNGSRDNYKDMLVSEHPPTTPPTTPPTCGNSATKSRTFSVLGSVLILCIELVQ